MCSSLPKCRMHPYLPSQCPHRAVQGNGWISVRFRNEMSLISKTRNDLFVLAILLETRSTSPRTRTYFYHTMPGTIKKKSRLKKKVGAPLPVKTKRTRSSTTVVSPAAAPSKRQRRRSPSALSAKPSVKTAAAASSSKPGRFLRLSPYRLRQIACRPPPPAQTAASSTTASSSASSTLKVAPVLRSFRRLYPLFQFRRSSWSHKRTLTESCRMVLSEVGSSW